MSIFKISRPKIINFQNFTPKKLLIFYASESGIFFHCAALDLWEWVMIAFVHWHFAKQELCLEEELLAKNEFQRRLLTTTIAHAAVTYLVSERSLRCAAWKNHFRKSCNILVSRDKERKTMLIRINFHLDGTQTTTMKRTTTCWWCSVRDGMLYTWLHLRIFSNRCGSRENIS